MPRVLEVVLQMYTYTYLSTGGEMDAGIDTHQMDMIQTKAGLTVASVKPKRKRLVAMPANDVHYR